MSITSSSAALIQARRDLFNRWHAVAQVWQDERARTFARDYLDPIDPAIARANDAVSEMSAAMDKALRECEP